MGDRLAGALEMPLDSFASLAEGGDLPMHRVWYIRCGSKVIWDRKTKLDLVFGSGAGSEAPSTSEETERLIAEAAANMQRMQEEQQHARDIRLHEQLHSKAVLAGSRDERIRCSWMQAVFKDCDLDRDGLLSKDEMQIFAVATGFEGSELEWDDEFAALCAEHGVACGAGIDIAAFEKLVNDTSGAGCFCSTKELRQISEQLHQRAQCRRRSQHEATTVPS